MIPRIWIRTVLAEVLLSIVVGALLLSVASGALADGAQPRPLSLVLGAFACFLYFWPGLLAAGVLSGVATEAVAAKPRILTIVGFVAPVVLLPGAVLAMVFRNEGGGFPLIQNADPYLYWGAAAGAIVGLCMLLFRRATRGREKSVAVS
jgi:hypothetical protein